MLQPATLAKAALTAVSLTALISGPAAIAAEFPSNGSANSEASNNIRFGGSSIGRFGPPDIDEAIDPDAMFSVERPAFDTEVFVLGEPGPDSMPNRLTFSGNRFDAGLDQVFSVGTLSYLNGQTFEGTNVSSVPLEISLSLTEPADHGFDVDYRFGFDLTPNVGEADSADQLTISERPEEHRFSVDEQDYQLDVLGFSQDRGATFVSSLQVPEDSTTQSLLFAQMRLVASGINDDTPTEVPEPSVLAGLLMIGGCFLKKRAA